MGVAEPGRQRLGSRRNGETSVKNGVCGEMIRKRLFSPFSRIDTRD
jgi:hypothetical protein